MSDTSVIGLNLADRFRITGVIGEGGMATVYRGVEKGKQTELAVKIMNPDLAKESRFVRRFRREAKAASMLKHPNTVQIVEFGVDQGYVFMVMELLLGQDLAMLLHRERKIPEARAVQIAIQVCRALSAAHEQSIVHRDLKPDNIMLVRHPPGVPLPVVGMSPSDFVKVLDFGIAKILDDEPGAPVDSRIEPITQEKSMLTRVGTIVGTPAYMAPEQGRAEAVDARTDIYAVGVLIYELITGRVPFTGETPMQVVMRHVNEPPRPPSEFHPVSRDLERLIMRALAKWPSERQQSAEEMAFDLLAVLPKLAGAGAPTSAAESVQKTLVLEPSPPVPQPAPRPAAGMPPPARPAPPPPAAGRPPPQAAAASMSVHSGDAANPFPTLNIEVPDDIFPPDLPVIPVPPKGDRAPQTAAVATRPLPSTDPSPTHRTDTSASRGPGPAGPPAAAVVGRAPVARPQPQVPVVAAGASRGPALAQTLQSEAPPPPSSDDDEGATLVKSPTEADKARMSLAEEAMAKALAGAPPPRAAVGVGVPKLTDPESVEPTLIQGNTGPTPAAVPGRPKDGPLDLRALQETVRVDPSDAEKAVKDAVAARGSIPQAPPSPIPLASVPPPNALSPNAGTLALDEPPKVGATTGSNRKPTSELLPVSLPEDRASNRPEPAEAAALWKPKASRKLGGAAALLIGILIGTVLVATALIVAISLRR